MIKKSLMKDFEKFLNDRQPERPEELRQDELMEVIKHLRDEVSMIKSTLSGITFSDGIMCVNTDMFPFTIANKDGEIIRVEESGVKIFVKPEFPNSRWNRFKRWLKKFFAVDSKE